MGIIPKKSYGQHFLTDQAVVKKMVDAAEIKKGETVLEIGPGTGVITEALVAAGAKVIAVEADRDLIKPLQEKFGDTIELIQGDIFSVFLPPFPRGDRGGLPAGFADKGLPLSDSKYKLVSNLPYHIASHVLRQFLSTSPRPTRLVIMTQREVADRIVAKPPKMGLLSVVCQLYASCKKIANVAPGAFRPAPKVGSAIVRLDVFPPPFPRGDRGGLPVKRVAGIGGLPLQPEKIIKLAKTGFSSKRKQLQRNLSASPVGLSVGLRPRDAKIFPTEKIKETLQEMGLDPRIRAENLTVEQWVELYHRL